MIGNLTTNVYKASRSEMLIGTLTEKSYDDGCDGVSRLSKTMLSISSHGVTGSQ